MEKKEKQILIDELIEELREMEDGTQTTVVHLVKRCGYDAGQMQRNGELMELYGDLLKAARRARITLDWSAYDDMDIGLPYRVPFVVRNAKAQIRCPRCGSTRTARILYGMPAFGDDLKEKLEAGKIRLGGCCITGADPERYCNDCKRAFGAAGQTANGKTEFFADIVTRIRFVRRPYRSPEWTELTIEKTDAGAHVKSVSGTFPSEREYDISAGRWENLVSALYGGLYLNDWKRRFEDLDVDDGERWELTVGMTEGRKRVYKGDNGYPPYWKEFEKRIRPFLNGR